MKLIDSVKKPTKTTSVPADLFKRMVEGSADGMLALDRSGTVLFANPAAADALGRAVEDLIGADFGVPLTTRDVVEIELLHPLRGPQIAEMRLAGSGADLAVVMLRDVSQRVRLQNELERLALADQLTGISNRRAFLALGEQALRVAKRERRPALLVFVDIDQMKMINDRFGHTAGDRAVIETARMLTRTVRDSDIVARVGGDEFCVLLAGSTDRHDSIDDAMHRLATAAKGVGENLSFPLTVTLGAAEYDPDGEPSIGDLMEAADAKMYEEKRRGYERLKVAVMGDGRTVEIARASTTDDDSLSPVDDLDDLVQLCRDQAVDLLVMDGTVGELRTLLEQLRRKTKVSTMPVVLVQHDTDTSLEEQALHLGAADVITDGMAPGVVTARFRRAAGRGIA